MSIPVAYDVVRLFLGPTIRTPRGIDRVELEYARHLLNDTSREIVGILPTPWGIRTFERDRLLRGLACIEALWSENRPSGDDPVWLRLRAELLGAPVPATIPDRPGPFGAGQQARRLLSLIGATGFSFGRSAVSRVPRGAVYLNIGHMGLAIPAFLRWLDRRPDVHPVFMLHDVIPIEVPHLVEASATRFMGRMVESTARHAGGLIVNSSAAGASVTAELARRNRPDLPTLTLPLPVAKAFQEPGDSPEPGVMAHPYFLIVGAIEPRKNHKVLFAVWERLFARLGRASPRLIVIGMPAWRGPEIIAAFEASSARPVLFRAEGLGTPALIRLMRGARAVLMPSRAEGFGLPLIEAAALGVPVIASDIPAHREVAPEGATLIGMEDVDAWEQAVLGTLATEGPRQPARPRIADWPAYFAQLDAFLEQLGARG